MRRVEKTESPKRTSVSKWSLVTAVLLLAVLMMNGFVVAAAGGKYVLNLFDALGGLGAFIGFCLLTSLFFLLPPLISRYKAGKGSALLWCLVWNLALFAVMAGFGPLEHWLKKHGSTVPALMLGEDAWLVEVGLQEKLGWGTGFDEIELPDLENPEAATFVERSEQILETLRGAETFEELKSVVTKANLDRLEDWGEKRKLFAVKYVRDQLELLDHDAKKMGGKWRVRNFSKKETVATLTFRASKKNSRTKYIDKTLRFGLEDGVWKADFSEQIDAFDMVMKERDARRGKAQGVPEEMATPSGTPSAEETPGKHPAVEETPHIESTAGPKTSPSP